MNSVYLNWENIGGQEECEEAETSVFLSAVRGRCSVVSESQRSAILHLKEQNLVILG